jgi:hypothetical protein
MPTGSSSEPVFHVYRWSEMPTLAKEAFAHYYALKFLIGAQLRAPQALEEQAASALSRWEDQAKSDDFVRVPTATKQSRVKSPPSEARPPETGAIRLLLMDWTNLAPRRRYRALCQLAVGFLLDRDGSAPLDLVEAASGLRLRLQGPEATAVPVDSRPHE